MLAQSDSTRQYSQHLLGLLVRRMISETHIFRISSLLGRLILDVLMNVIPRILFLSVSPTSQLPNSLHFGFRSHFG